MYKSEELDKEIQKIRPPANSSDLESKDKQIILCVRKLRDDSFTAKGFWDSIILGAIVFFVSMMIQGVAKIPTMNQGLLGLFSAIMLVGAIEYVDRQLAAKNIKLLIELLMDTPYEIRVFFVGYFKDKTILKITIEENLADPAGVIKEKSRHITAYLDMSADWEKQLDFIKSLVNKAEKSFKPFQK